MILSYLMYQYGTNIQNYFFSITFSRLLMDKNKRFIFDQLKKTKDKKILASIFILTLAC